MAKIVHARQPQWAELKASVKSLESKEEGQVIHHPSNQNSPTTVVEKGPICLFWTTKVPLFFEKGREFDMFNMWLWSLPAPRTEGFWINFQTTSFPGCWETFCLLKSYYYCGSSTAAPPIPHHFPLPLGRGTPPATSLTCFRVDSYSWVAIIGGGMATLWTFLRKLWSFKKGLYIPGPPKGCFMKVFRYLKLLQKHSFGGAGLSKRLKLDLHHGGLDLQPPSGQLTREKSLLVPLEISWNIHGTYKTIYSKTISLVHVIHFLDPSISLAEKIKKCWSFWPT